MAEIMTDIRGACRRGLYAQCSTAKPSATVSTTTTGSATYNGMVAER